MGEVMRAFEKSAAQAASWHAIESPSWSHRMKKFLRHPFSYILYQFSKLFRIAIKAKTFLGDTFFCYLPDYLLMWNYGIVGDPAEIALSRFLIAHLKEGNTVLDVGSNCGFYALLTSHLVGKRGMVYAFEPTPHIFDMLKKNTDGFINIYAEPVAVADADGTAEFSLNRVFPVANSLVIEDEALDQKKILVKTVSLDNYCQGFDPDFIKLDVEGAEALVVKGASRLLSRTNPFISLEILKQEDGPDMRAAELLCELGYTPHILLADAQLKEIDLDDVLERLMSSDVDFENLMFKKI